MDYFSILLFTSEPCSEPPYLFSCEYWSGLIWNINHCRALQMCQGRIISSLLAKAAQYVLSLYHHHQKGTLLACTGDWGFYTHKSKGQGSAAVKPVQGTVLCALSSSRTIPTWDDTKKKLWDTAMKWGGSLQFLFLFWLETFVFNLSRQRADGESSRAYFQFPNAVLCSHLWWQGFADRRSVSASNTQPRLLISSS